MLDYNGH